MFSVARVAGLETALCLVPLERSSGVNKDGAWWVRSQSSRGLCDATFL